MTVPLTGTGGLMTRLGKIGKMLNDVNTNAGTTIPADVLAINNQYLALDQNLIGDLYNQEGSWQTGQLSFLQYCQLLATNTLNQMVNDDTPLNDPTNVVQALTVLLAQWIANGDYISSPGVSVGNPVYGSTNRGTGVLIATLLDQFETQQFSAFNEQVSLACTADASTGATNLNEPFSVLTPAAAANQLGFTWPAGSGINISIQSTDPAGNNALGNTLTNSDFETWVANIPSNWTLSVGTAGSDFLNGGGQAYSGASCLQFTQFSGAPLTQLTQLFGATAGTPYVLLPDTVYGFVIWAKKTSGLSGAGTLKLGLVDATNTTSYVTDDAGTSQFTSFTCASLTTSYVAKTAFFRTPRALNANGIRLSLGLSVAIADSGQSVYLDYAGFAPASRLYAGGPLMNLFSGNKPWAQGDTITVQINNGYQGSWQKMLERLFSLRSLGFQFPTSGGVLINDSLLS